MSIKHVLTAILLMLIFAAPADAGPLEDADIAFHDGDFATALQIWRPMADHGVARAQNNLGLMYISGQGVHQDNAEAMRWFRLAANQGYATGQNNLGKIYNNGKGVTQDYAEAKKLYRLAANQENAGGQFSLGILYALGQGVPQDYVSAHMWFNLAAANGEKDAESERDEIAKNMTPAQIAEAQKLAREWKPEMAR